MRRIFTGRSIHALAFSPDGQTLAYGGWGHVSLLDVDTEHDARLQEIGKSIVVSLTFSRDGRQLGWSAHGSQSQVGIHSGRPFSACLPHPVPGASPAIAFLPDGKAVAAVQSTLRVGNGNKPWEPFVNETISVQGGLAISAAGMLLATAQEEVDQPGESSIVLWDAWSWRERAAFAWDAGYPRALAVAPDGLTLAAGGETGELVIWDVDL